MIAGKTCYFTQIPQYYWSMGELGKNIKKTNIKNDICLHSEIPSEMMEFFYASCLPNKTAGSLFGIFEKVQNTNYLYLSQFNYDREVFEGEGKGNISFR